MGGVSSVRLTIRDANDPETVLLELHSPSPGPNDPATHVWRFSEVEAAGLQYELGDYILIGIGVGEFTTVDSSMNVTTHLPLTVEPPDAAPFILTTDGPDSGEIQMDPFEGKTLAIRALFE